MAKYTIELQRQHTLRELRDFFLDSVKKKEKAHVIGSLSHDLEKGEATCGTIWVYDDTRISKETIDDIAKELRD